MISERLDGLRRELRRDDPERYLLSLFASAEARPYIWAVLAFAAEIGRIPDAVSEEMLGHIRLAWWREALDELYAGKPPRGHPVAEALAGFITTHQPPRLWFDAMLEARSEQLESPRIRDEAAFTRFAQATSGMVSRLSALTETKDPVALEMAGSVGALYGKIGLFRSIGYQLRQGYCLLPEEWLDQAGIPAETLIRGEVPANDRLWADLCQKIVTKFVEANEALSEKRICTVHTALHNTVNKRWLRKLKKSPNPLDAAFSQRLSVLPLQLVGMALLTKS